jgi:hypothetical protein
LQGCRSVGGKFASIRETLDFDYHGCYSAERTRLQDQIITDSVGGGVVLEHPWIIFTAGAMGAGKGHTVEWMSEHGHFPVDELAHIDPDTFRARLPEWPVYLQNDPETAGRLTHRESGYCVEVAQEAALQQSKGICVDGSLRDSDWYSRTFAYIRRKYPQYRIAIIHVCAPWDTVVLRAAERARSTGRLVPEEALRESFASVPQAVERLCGLADITAHVENVDVPKLMRIRRGGGPQPWRRRPWLMRVSHEASWSEVEFCFRQVPCRLHPVTLSTFLDGLAASHGVVLFSNSYCSLCGKTRELIEAEVGAGSLHTLELDLLTLDGSPIPGLDQLRTGSQAAPVLLQRDLARKSGIRTLPQVFVSGRFLGNYGVLKGLSDDGKLAEALLRRTSPAAIVGGSPNLAPIAMFSV